jgi:hypothetical protein
MPDAARVLGPWLLERRLGSGGSPSSTVFESTMADTARKVAS